MTTSTIDESQRNAARLAGFFYLLTFAIVLAVNFGINEHLMVAGDPAQTSRNILAHERLFRIGIASNLIYEAGLLVLLSALRDPQAIRSHLGVAGRVLAARLCLDVGPDVAQSADRSAAVERCRLPARPGDRTSRDAGEAVSLRL